MNFLNLNSSTVASFMIAELFKLKYHFHAVYRRIKSIFLFLCFQRRRCLLYGKSYLWKSYIKTLKIYICCSVNNKYKEINTRNKYKGKWVLHINQLSVQCCWRGKWKQSLFIWEWSSWDISEQGNVIYLDFCNAFDMAPPQHPSLNWKYMDLMGGLFGG